MICQGHLFTDVGQMTALNAAAGVPGGSPVPSGWAHKPTGEPYVEDLVAGAVPGGSSLRWGGAYHPDGRRYVTTEAVAAGDQYHGAMRHRADGALRVIVAAVEATDTLNAGWACKQTGEARMSIT